MTAAMIMIMIMVVHGIMITGVVMTDFKPRRIIPNHSEPARAIPSQCMPCHATSNQLKPLQATSRLHKPFYSVNVCSCLLRLSSLRYSAMPMLAMPIFALCPGRMLAMPMLALFTNASNLARVSASALPESTAWVRDMCPG